MLIGLASSGPHSNGYSLIRKVIAVSGADLDQDLDGASLADRLLAPTRLYIRSVLPLTRALRVHALAHITGGGLTENLPRVLPPGTCARVDLDSWTRPVVFDWLQTQGGIAEAEMLRTFNCGVGMIVCVAPEDADTALALLREAGEAPWIMGRIETSASEGEPCVRYNGGSGHV